MRGFPTRLAEWAFDIVRANSSRRMCLRMSWCSFCVCTLTVLSLLAGIHSVFCYTCALRFFARRCFTGEDKSLFVDRKCQEVSVRPTFLLAPTIEAFWRALSFRILSRRAHVPLSRIGLQICYERVCS